MALHVALAQLLDPDEELATLYDCIAYLGRYARQGYREVLAMSVDELHELMAATARLVEAEGPDPTGTAEK